MAINSDTDLHTGDSAKLTVEELRWLHQLESVSHRRVLLPMRTTEKLGKLGLIELRSSQLTLTERGRQFLHPE